MRRRLLQDHSLCYVRPACAATGPATLGPDVTRLIRRVVGVSFHLKSFISNYTATKNNFLFFSDNKDVQKEASRAFTNKTDNCREDFI